MTSHLTRGLAALALCLPLSFQAGWAADTADAAEAASAPAEHAAPSGPAVRVRRDAITYRLDEQGRCVQTQERALTVLRRQALAGARQRTLSYNPQAEKVEVLEAYTRKGDGRRIDVAAADLQPSAPEAPGAGTLTVRFPEVEVGDTVVLTHRLSTLVPMFAGQFSVLKVFDPAAVYDQVRVTLDAPAGLWTQEHASGLREVARSQKNGRRVIEWAWDNKAPAPALAPRQEVSVYDPEAGPSLSISTFHDNGEIAQAYGAGARAKAVVSEGVQKLADEIAPGAMAPRERARALYEWVATHIGLAGVCLEAGATLPAEPDTVLARRQGNCTDHATLLQALLAAKGIASTQALVNAGNVYRLPSVPVASLLNHVINYIPSLDLFLDASSDSTPFGLLPFAETDKPVFLVDGARPGLRTPVPPPGSHAQHMSTVVTFHADGSATGQVDVDLRGMFAANSRARLREVPPEVKAQMVPLFFHSIGTEAEGRFSSDDPRGLSERFHFQARFKAKKLLQRPGGGAFKVEPLFYNESPVATYLTAAEQPIDEHADVACSSGHTQEDYSYVFPKGMRIVSVPKDVRLDSELLSYRASYTLKGRRLSVRRVFDDRTPGSVCTPASLRAYQAFARQVSADLQAQVVYK